MKIPVIIDPHFSSATPSSRIDNYFESVMKKFVYVLDIAKQNDNILIIAGDVFQMPAQPDYIKNAITRVIRDSGVLVYSIIGNHDLLYYNTDFLERTSLGLMFENGHLKELTTLVLSNGWTLLGQRPGEPFPVAPNEKTVIVSHAFLGEHFNDKLSISHEEIEKSKARFLCLGHDHNQYPPREFNGTIVVRPGALSRGSSATENKVRVISYALLDLDKGEVEYVPVPFVHDFNDVFKTKLVEGEKSTISFDDIRDFIDKLNKADVSVNPYDILIQLDLSDHVFQKSVYYLESVGLIKRSI